MHNPTAFTSDITSLKKMLIVNIHFPEFSRLNSCTKWSASQLNNFSACIISIETPPPGYISEDGETSDQQMNQSMDTGTLD